MNFRSPYTHDRAISALFATTNTEESMTQQSDREDTDINVIMKKYAGHGIQLPQRIGEALSGDFTDIGDYRSMVEKIQAADEAFAQIPAEIRGRFLNDPAKFIEFASKPDNQDELRKLGLAPPAPEPPKPPEPMLVRVVPEPEAQK